jgi:hypothetical protein
MVPTKWLLTPTVALTVTGLSLWAWLPPDTEGSGRAITCPTEAGPRTQKEVAVALARKSGEAVERGVPPIDAARPARTEIATFALG